MRKLNLLFVMLLSLMGVTQVCAQDEEFVTDDFSGYTTTSSGTTLGENWVILPGSDGQWGAFGSTRDYVHYNEYGEHYVAGNSANNYNKGVWLVLKKQVVGDVTFTATNGNSNSAFTIYVSTAEASGESFAVTGTATSYSVPSRTSNAKSFTFNAGDNATYVAFCLVGTSKNPKLQSVTYKEASAAEGAVLSVSGFESGSTFDFGTVPAGETKTFTLNNLGADELTITSIAVSGDFEITDGSDITSIASMGSASVTVATPDKDATGALTIVSNDENSPYVISLTSTYKVPAPIIALDPTEIEFGKVTENASQVITVSNSGEAELVGTITSDNADFTVSPSEINVPVGETAEFTVTYNYDAEAYGAHTATITVTPSVGEAATLAVSAKVADPNVWSEDFEGEGQPEGWEVGSSNWTFANGVARATYGSYSTGYKYFLTTPTLEVAEGESLEFQYRGTASYTDIRIQISKDGGEFEDFETISCNTMTEFETYVIDGLEPGNYQFRFANDNYELDNFEGFKLATLEHDMAITASDIPSSGDTASEYVASVTVQEKAGKDETVTAKLYIDGNVVATAEQEVAANEEATIELSFEPTEAVVFKKAYIEITYAEGLTKKTDEVSVYIQEVTVKVLDEVAVNEFSGTTETYDRVKLNYTVKQGWNTIAVPFMISDLSVFGENVQAYLFSDYADGELKFSRTTMIPAATPCVFYTEAPSTKQITFNSVTIYSYNAVEEGCAVTNGEATFQGTYAPIAAPGMQGKYGVVPSTGKIQKGGAGASIKALRAYFILPENVDGSKLIMTFVEEEGDATSIKGIENLNIENAEMFDLSGRKVIGQKKAGIYILNGKKVVVK